MTPMALAIQAMREAAASRLVRHDWAADALASLQRGEKPSGGALNLTIEILTREVYEWQNGKVGWKSGRRGRAYLARVRAPNPTHAASLARVVARLTA